MEEILLVFEDSIIRDYWYNYIRRYLTKLPQTWFITGFCNNKKVIKIDNKKLIFISKYDQEKMRGIRHCKFCYEPETELEKDFKGTLIKIIKDGGDKK